MNAHTPGPWRVIESNLLPYHGDHVADMSNGLMVVASSKLGDPLADARLIAATPELLEELNNCFDLLNTCFPDAPVDSCIGVAIIKARAALDKAVQS